MSLYFQKKAAKKVSNSKSVPVSKQPVKTSSTSDSDEEVFYLNLCHWFLFYSF